MNAERRAKLKRALRWAGGLSLGISYPFLAHLAAASPTRDFFNVLVAITPLFGLTLVLAWRSPQRTVLLASWLAACAALYSLSDWLLMHYHWVFLLEHAGMYALLCGTFARTLQAGHTPMISGFARIVHGALSPALISYTRSATWAWSFYFGSISGLSLLLFWLAPISVWSAFANLLGAPLLLLMFMGEYAVRCYVLPVEDRTGPLEAIRAYRQASSGGTARQP